MATKTRTNFTKVHEPAIAGGAQASAEAWVSAGAEAIAKRMSASKYAEASEPVHHTVTTVRLYISFIIAGLKKYGTADKMWGAYDKVYEYRNITDLRSFIAGQTKTAKAKSAKRTKADLQKAALNYSIAELREMLAYRERMAK